MQRVLFHDTIFGPIHSRRLGSSLGVNLSPRDGKVCSFDCLYCEAGFNAQGPGTTGFPTPAEVSQLLEAKLKAMKESGEPLDVITFSGNGEPTLHPQFSEIIEETIRLRNEYFPEVKISVLNNSTRLGKPEVCAALNRVDNNILKLDSAIEETMRKIGWFTPSCPSSPRRSRASTAGAATATPPPSPRGPAWGSTMPPRRWNPCSAGCICKAGPTGWASCLTR